MIKTWQQRCEEHPDHQTGMVSNQMIMARMQEEIDDLRAAQEELEKAARQALEAMDDLHSTGDTHAFDLRHQETTNALRAALATENIVQDWDLLTEAAIRYCEAERTESLRAALKEKA